MIAIASRFLDAFTGQGESSVTVPPMDGALRPNAVLDGLSVLHAVPGVDNLTAVDGQSLFSAGASLMTCSLDGESPRELAKFESEISALTVRGDGVVAIGLDAGGILLTDAQASKRKRMDRIEGAGSSAPTALAFDGSGALHACIGSNLHRPSEWKRDLMGKGRTGSVWQIRPDDFAAFPVATGLAFPNGIAFDDNGNALVSEAWKHRILRRSPSDGQAAVLEDLPGYPGRLSPAAGGFWLAVFAPRSQMIEFVLREDAYRRRMLREIDERYWMAPSLRSGRIFLEPLQGGGVRHLGIHKPWAPTRSYGLAVRLNREGQPVRSWHSRADGQRHGVMSCLEHAGRVFIACKGDGVLVHVDDKEGLV